MARLFDDAVPDDIQIASALLSGVPISMACWFNSDSITAGQMLLTITDTAGNDNWFYLAAAGNVGGDPLRAQTNAAAAAAAATSSGYSADTWHHGCAVFAATNDRRVYIDGGSKGTEATDLTPAGLDVSTIGSLRILAGPTNPMSGLIAEAAFWNIALTDAEVAVLAAGYSPLLVRPQNLVFYAPLIRELLDVVGGVTLTNNGSTVGDHTRVLYPATQSLVVPPGVAVAAIASQRLKIGHGR